MSKNNVKGLAGQKGTVFLLANLASDMVRDVEKALPSSSQMLPRHM